MDFASAVKSIISQQQLIIGPLAIEEANKVPGLSVSRDGGDVVVGGDGKVILEGLVNQYASLFGRVSIEVCREAVRSSGSEMPNENLPEILK